MHISSHLNIPVQVETVAVAQSGYFTRAPMHLGKQLATAMARLRNLDLFKPPGVAETIDWATDHSPKERGTSGHNQE